jgi:hypothetical protein
MIFYILLSFTAGFEGGVFELKGNDIVSPEFGTSFGVFCDFYVTPNLNYGLSFNKGKAAASTRTMVVVYDTTSGQQRILSRVRGEDFEFISGEFCVNWLPIRTVLLPYLSGWLGLKSWKFVSGGDVVMSLNENEFKGVSLSLGGGAGLRSEIAGFVFSAELFSDFIFSEDSDWEVGFGSSDDNEWTVNTMFKLGKEF